MAKERKCVVCGVPFTAKHADTKTCAKKKCRYRFRSLKSSAENGSPLTKEPTESIKEERNNREYEKVIAHEVRTLEQLVAVCEIDTEIWDIERWSCGKWDFAVKDEDTQQIITRQMFRLRATMKRKVELIDVKQQIAGLVRDCKGRFSKPPTFRTRSAPKGLLYEESIYDPHFGKLAWGPETGGNDYDLEIALGYYKSASEILLGRVQGFDIKEILLPIGNDMFHIDDRKGQTHRGTAMDYDSRFEKIFELGTKAVIDNIYQLSAVAPVRVVAVRGNHDFGAAWHLGMALGLVFEQHKHITVDNDPKIRKYVEFGRVGLMLTHGDKALRQQGTSYSRLFAAEQPEMWARTHFREAHIGHFHKESVVSDRGFTVRFFPALCEADAWHTEEGYVGNIPTGMGMVWHPEEGRVATVEWRPPQQRAA